MPPQQRWRKSGQARSLVAALVSTMEVINRGRLFSLGRPDVEKIRKSGNYLRGGGAMAELKASER